MISTDAYLPTKFSQQTLDLQEEFCCNGKDKRKIIRWISCKPGAYMGNKTLFSSADLGLCNWYQEVDDYYALHCRWLSYSIYR